MEEILKKPEGPVEVVDIQFRPGQKVYFFDPAGKTYNAGDHVIIDTARVLNMASAPAAIT